MASVRKDLSGMKFGRLTVLSEAPPTPLKSGRKLYNWNCKCSCGNERVKSSRNLLRGDTKSCGCLHSDNVAKQNKENAKHGDSRTRLYKIWAGMKNRCYCNSNHEYYNYGGRGIKVCDEWMDYINFKKWAESNGYTNSRNCTLDRIGNDMNYSPDNCRWATPTVQSNNRRSNRKLGFNNSEHTISEWSRKTGIRSDTILYRIKHGWSVEAALTTPVRK